MKISVDFILDDDHVASTSMFMQRERGFHLPKTQEELEMQLREFFRSYGSHAQVVNYWADYVGGVVRS